MLSALFLLGRSCTSSPRRRLISLWRLGRKMSPQPAAVERMTGIPGLPRLTAVLRVPQASPLQKPRRQKVRWCFQERSPGLCPLGPCLLSGLMIPPFTWISGIMGKAVQILGLAQFELSSTALRCPGLGKRWMGTALMMLFRLVFAAPTPAGHSPLLRQCWP